MIKFLMLIILIASSVIGDTVEYLNYEAFRFLEFGIGARAIGMGNAIVASTNDAYSIYWNPARLTKISGISVSTSISYLYNPKSELGEPIAQFTKPQIAFSYSLGQYGSIGLSGCYLGNDDVKYLYSYENIASNPPEPIYKEIFLSLGYGNEVIKGFDLGVSLLTYQLTPPPDKFFSKNSDLAVSTSLGMHYALSPEISLGVLYYDCTSVFLKKDSIIVIDTIINNNIDLDTIEVEFRIPVKAKAILGIGYKPIDNLIFELDIKTRETISPFKLYFGGEYSYFPLKAANGDGPLGLKIRSGIRDMLGKEKFGEKEFANYAFTAGLGFVYSIHPIRSFLDCAGIYRPEVCKEKHFSYTLSFCIGIVF